MSGRELLNYLQRLSEEVLDKFIVITHPNGGRSTLDRATWSFISRRNPLRRKLKPSENYQTKNWTCSLALVRTDSYSL